MSSPNHGEHALHHDLLRLRLVCRHAACPGCHCLGSLHHHQSHHQALTLSLSFQPRYDLPSCSTNQLGCHPSQTPDTDAISNAKENKSRLTHQCTPSDKVLTVLDPDEHHGQPKMNQPTKGPFTITTVHNNGAVDINCGSFIETINICKPFHS